MTMARGRQAASNDRAALAAPTLTLSAEGSCAATCTQQALHLQYRRYDVMIVARSSRHRPDSSNVTRGTGKAALASPRRQPTESRMGMRSDGQSQFLPVCALQTM